MGETMPSILAVDPGNQKAHFYKGNMTADDLEAWAEQLVKHRVIKVADDNCDSADGIFWAGDKLHKGLYSVVLFHNARFAPITWRGVSLRLKSRVVKVCFTKFCMFLQLCVACAK